MCCAFAEALVSDAGGAESSSSDSETEHTTLEQGNVAISSVSASLIVDTDNDPLSRSVTRIFRLRRQRL